MTANENELSWIDRPLRGLLSLSWPIATSMVGYAVMTIVDTAFVGHLGQAALAGVGLGGLASFVLMVFAIGLLRGVKILVSQAVGAGRRDQIAVYLSAGLTWALGLGVLFAVAGQLLGYMLPWLSSTEAAGASAASYLSVRVLGSPALLVFVAMRETAYGHDDSRSPMIATLCANVANVALDYALIFGADLGVVGAAWASVCGVIVELIVLSVLTRRLLRGVRLGGPLRQVWDVGFPTGVQFLIEFGAFATLTVMLSRLSEADIASHVIALQALHFSFLPALAVGEAASVMAGQAVGANRDDLVRGIATRALWVAGAYAALCTIALVFGAESIVSLFTESVELVAITVPLLYVAAVFQVADAGNVVARSVLRGAGDVRYPAVVGVVVAWALTPTSCWFFGYHLGLGAVGGWLGLCAEILLGAAILWHRLGAGGWQLSASSSRERAATLNIREAG